MAEKYNENEDIDADKVQKWMDFREDLMKTEGAGSLESSLQLIHSGEAQTAEEGEREGDRRRQATTEGEADSGQVHALEAHIGPHQGGGEGAGRLLGGPHATISEHQEVEGPPMTLQNKEAKPVPEAGDTFGMQEGGAESTTTTIGASSEGTAFGNTPRRRAAWDTLLDNSL
jgi:hypothetical protein